MTAASDVEPKNLKDPTFYRHATPEKERSRPVDRVDYRDQNGPLLSYVWCGGSASPEDPDQALTGQDLYLGAEIGCDGNMYCIPGHALRVLKLNTSTDQAAMIGPILVGKYKWLRGVLCGESIYGIPCHTDTVLKIHVPSGAISLLPIDYESFFGTEDLEIVRLQRAQEWKYHGGSISPIDNCIYAIPQSATHVLKVDPVTDKCTLFGQALHGRYKWYGGVVGRTDHAIYGIPHNSPSVLRIHATQGVSLHGDFGDGGHKWHGASTAENGVIVCVPANADSVLCITPADPAPILTMIGDETMLKSGRHRKDKKYKYLGAIDGPDGRVFCFPCASERVLAVDTTIMMATEIGPNIYDQKMERLCQNKWQNGVFIKKRKCIFGIPLAAESILRIDFSKNKIEAEITTWLIPAPHRGLSKWEGAVVSPNNVVYTIPNNHKAILRVEQPVDISGESHNDASEMVTKNDRPDYRDKADLVYKSGIPTVRASAHRVKFSPKNRKHDPRPRNDEGEITGTLWLPRDICRERISSYNAKKYDLVNAAVALLKRCDPSIVGSFRNHSDRLEDFVVPTQSTWRTVNGGKCEAAQRYLSDAVTADENFINLFTKLVEEAVLPDLKQHLMDSGAVSKNGIVTFYYQCPPTLRLQPGPAWAQVKTHNDAEYGHQYGELNFWVPLTDRVCTGVDLWCESTYMADDYHPLPAKIGEIIKFHGSSCRHYVNTNTTEFTRVSFDFRVGVQGFFDPFWEMEGTNDDHSRRSFQL